MPCDNMDVTNLAGEDWRPVREHETSYEVSSLGRVRRIPRICDPGNRKGWHVPASIVKQQITEQKGSGQPILSCVLVFNGRRTATTVAKLVFEAFIGPASPGYHILHRNRDSSDNRPGNLHQCLGDWRGNRRKYYAVSSC